MSTVASATADALETIIAERLAQLDTAAKIRLVSGRDHWSTWPEPAAGLRALTLSDGTVGIRGTRWTEEDTWANLPSSTAIAATFDAALARRLGAVVGAEARRKDVDVILGPVVNLQRSPYGGRHFEAFSEDPFLTGVIGAAMVAGMQDEGRAAVVKRFIANEAETDRLNSDSVVDERTLHEAYLAPFARIAAAGALGVMSSYNRLNGRRVTDHPVLTEVLKEAWGFDGLVVSDWGAIRDVAGSAPGGTDLAMPGPHTAWAAGLSAAVASGEVPIATLDDKVRRLFRLAARVGALEGVAPLVDASVLPAAPRPESPAVRETLRAAAAQGTVLLRNRRATLPWDAAGLRSLAVIGPSARTPRINGGGSAAVVPPTITSPLESLTAALPDTTLTYAEGARPATLVAPLTAAHGTSPDGTGVVQVEFLDEDGAVLGGEVRDRPDTLVYGMGYPDGVPQDRVRSIRATTRLASPGGGDWLFSAAGAGHARVTFDGAVALDEQLVPHNSDAVIGMSLPPQAILPLHLEAGVPVEAVFTYTPAPRTVAALRIGFDTAASDPDALIAQAVAAAADADAAIVFVGTDAEVEAEGFDRTTLALPGRQDDLVRAVAAAARRTVVVVTAGAPVLLPWRDEVDAIVVAWFGGQEAGPAIADVLTGAREPGGRLPVTFPADEEGLLSPFPDEDGRVVYTEGTALGLRACAAGTRRAAYAFGHGLGYTGWDVTPVAAAPHDGGIRVTAGVRNTGERPGRHVVQVYLSKPDDADGHPALWFAGAAVCEADPGAGVDAVIDVPRRLFEHWDAADHAWRLSPGPFRVHVGPASDRLVWQADVTPA